MSQPHTGTIQPRTARRVRFGARFLTILDIALAVVLVAALVTAGLLWREHHRTVGDLVRAVVGAGLTLVDIVEPEWPEGRDHVWGGWSRLRGELVPGTLIVVAERPA